MELLDAIKSRRSISRLSPPAPTAAELRLILDAAACAPDHGSLRPWRFIVLRDEAKDAFGPVLAAATEAEYRDRGQEPEPAKVQEGPHEDGPGPARGRGRLRVPAEREDPPLRAARSRRGRRAERLPGRHRPRVRLDVADRTERLQPAREDGARASARTATSSGSCTWAASRRVGPSLRTSPTSTAWSRTGPRRPERRRAPGGRATARSHPGPHRRPAAHADPGPLDPGRGVDRGARRAAPARRRHRRAHGRLQAPDRAVAAVAGRSGRQGRRPVLGRPRRRPRPCVHLPPVPRRHRRGHRTERRRPPALPDLEGRPARSRPEPWPETFPLRG